MKHSIVAVLLFLTMGPASAGNSYNSNPFIDMMRAMVNMFEAMQAMQNLSVHSGYDRGPVGSYPYSGNRPSWNDEQASPEQLEKLQGTWASPNRLLLIIRQNLARMYWSADRYRNFYVEVFPDRLRLTDAETRQSREFEYRLQGSRLDLRDPRGRVLQFFHVDDAGQATTPAPFPEEGYNFWDPNIP